MLLGQSLGLPQSGRFFMAAFQFKHHPLNVPVILVPT
jgi:hypothetical protein